MIFNNLQPINPEELFESHKLSTGQLFSFTIFSEGEHYDFSDISLLVVGVTESRAASNKNDHCGLAANEVRKEFYQLYAPNATFKILDLGNLTETESTQESYELLNNLLLQLRETNVPVLLVGGTQDNTLAQYMSYEESETPIEVVNIDERIDLHELKSNVIENDSYLWPMIMHHSEFLGKYTHLGYQQYFVPTKTLNALESLNFNCIRLGELKPGIKKIEPYIRQADMLTFDIGAVKSADAPGKSNQTPNGFAGEEACQIMRYAGMSDKISTVGVYEFNPSYDLNKQTAILISQMCWYFLEGILNRKPENPHETGTESNFRKYTIDNDELDCQIVFWKSIKTDRWWMEMPYKKKENGFDNEVVACNYEDYQTAQQGELPDRWLVAFHRLSH